MEEDKTDGTARRIGMEEAEAGGWLEQTQRLCSIQQSLSEIPLGGLAAFISRLVAENKALRIKCREQGAMLAQYRKQYGTPTERKETAAAPSSNTPLKDTEELMNATPTRKRQRTSSLLHQERCASPTSCSISQLMLQLEASASPILPTATTRGFPNTIDTLITNDKKEGKFEEENDGEEESTTVTGNKRFAARKLEWELQQTQAPMGVSEDMDSDAGEKRGKPCEERKNEMEEQQRVRVSSPQKTASQQKASESDSSLDLFSTSSIMSRLAGNHADDGVGIGGAKELKEEEKEKHHKEKEAHGHCANAHKAATFPQRKDIMKQMRDRREKKKELKRSGPSTIGSGQVIDVDALPSLELLPPADAADTNHGVNKHEHDGDDGSDNKSLDPFSNFGFSSQDEMEIAEDGDGQQKKAKKGESEEELQRSKKQERRKRRDRQRRTERKAKMKEEKEEEYAVVYINSTSGSSEEEKENARSFDIRALRVAPNTTPRTSPTNSVLSTPKSTPSMTAPTTIAARKTPPSGSGRVNPFLMDVLPLKEFREGKKSPEAETERRNSYDKGLAFAATTTGGGGRGSAIFITSEEEGEEEKTLEPTRGQKPSSRNVLNSSGSRHNTPNFAHVAVVRKKAERELLPAHECEQCKKWYDAMAEAKGGEDQQDRQHRVDACSRHKCLYAAPPTPPHYWDMGFPGDTQEE
ncbi:DNA endonuclease rbbp8 [Balamuthia mandrillaris]